MSAIPDGQFALSTRRGKQFNTMVHEKSDAMTGARARDAVFMHADDARALGLSEGDAVVLRNGFGELRGRVFLSPNPAAQCPGLLAGGQRPDRPIAAFAALERAGLQRLRHDRARPIAAIARPTDMDARKASRTRARVTAVEGERTARRSDWLATEEPLEIRVVDARRSSRS